MRRMSALGQKQTFAVQNAMSALPPKADMCGAKSNVRFVPIADMHRSKHVSIRSTSFSAVGKVRLDRLGQKGESPMSRHVRLF